VNYHSSYVIIALIGSQTDTICLLYAIVDQSTAVVYSVGQPIRANSEFEYAFTLSLFSVNPGPHTFTLVIVDNVGANSNEQTFNCFVVSPKTPNPSPIPTLPAAPVFPIQTLCAETTNFDPSGDDGTTYVGMTIQGLPTRMRIDRVVTASAIHCQPLRHFGVCLHTNVIHISTNTVVMNFRLASFSPSDVVTDADILFDSDPSVPIINWAAS
jgi:hypothetical protein